MLKYLSGLVDDLTSFKKGVVANPTMWASKGITPESIQVHIDNLSAINAAIDELSTNLSNKNADAHVMYDAILPEFNRYTKIAYAYYADEQNKLREYGLEPHKDAQPRPVPTQKPVISIEDDSDGIGFVLSIQRDPAGDLIEWHRGISADPTKTDIIPAMTLYKTTKKISFVDDDVLKGQRVWYKVRTVNTAGSSPWSEPVSRVQ
jgi:hypothetical protein